jgi:hypothetical protein
VWRCVQGSVSASALSAAMTCSSGVQLARGVCSEYMLGVGLCVKLSLLANTWCAVCLLLDKHLTRTMRTHSEREIHASLPGLMVHWKCCRVGIADPSAYIATIHSYCT